MANSDEQRRQQLIEHLIDEGVVSADDMQRHLLKADRDERRIVDVLYDERDSATDAVALAESMAELFGADVVNVEELDGHPATMTILPEELARNRGVLGCADPDREDRLALVVYDPVGLDSLVETVEAAAGQPPRIFLAPRDPLSRIIGEFYEAYESSGEPDGELPVASVLSGVRPLDIAPGSNVPSPAESAPGESEGVSDQEGSLDEESFGEDLERAVSESLDDLEDDWLSDEQQDEDDDFWPDDDEEAKPARRGSTPFGETVEPDASLTEDTATGDAAAQSEPDIETSVEGSGPNFDDAFADAWPEDDEDQQIGETSASGDIETDVSDQSDESNSGEASGLGGEASTDAQSTEEQEELRRVIEVADDLSGPPADAHDPNLSKSTSRETLVEIVEKHARMLRRLNRKIDYQKRIIEELSRLLVEGRVIDRGELYQRLRTLRDQFTE